MMKRILDIIFSIVGLIVVSPFMLIISILIKQEDQGLIFYKGVRVGKNKIPFKMYKFRTMVMNADKIGGPSTADDDSRITRIGKYLRRGKLDEMPQLINVIKGDMSFVGPRPEVPQEVETYTDEQMEIFSVRPGITDWACIQYHNEGEILKGSDDPHQAYREKIKPGKLALQIQYAKNHSLWVDFKIVIQTIATVLMSCVRK
ncbi:MAG: sugar transferase [Candidatus Omnitrophica bacterium]|nr:sugar transferase [Candidatus Omnitrophota bacterium]